MNAEQSTLNLEVVASDDEVQQAIDTIQSMFREYFKTYSYHHYWWQYTYQFRSSLERTFSEYQMDKVWDYCEQCYDFLLRELDPLFQEVSTCMVCNTAIYADQVTCTHHHWSMPTDLAISENNRGFVKHPQEFFDYWDKLPAHNKTFHKKDYYWQIRL